MTTLRIGTRGSDLALWQAHWVMDQMRSQHPALTIEKIIIKTAGDISATQPGGGEWPVGAFVSAIERALIDAEIDVAVHSYKDLPTQSPPELSIAAVPARAVVCDVLVTREPVDFEELPATFRLGTSSPRRSAQFLRHADVTIKPIRGNVPTRVTKLETDDLDGVVLAAAGLSRLGIVPKHCINLPVDRFVPAAAQGALAIQTRKGHDAQTMLSALDDIATRRAVEAERSVLRTMGAGCHTPVGALATIVDGQVRLHAQLFSDDGSKFAEGEETGTDPEKVGELLAKRLVDALGQPS